MDVMIHADIWSIVASFLESSPASLSRLSRTSKTMAQIIRPILFRTTKLSSWTSNRDEEMIHEALLLLSAHKHPSNLARFVRTLHLPVFGIHKLEVWEAISQASADAILQTKSLQSLFLPSSPYLSQHGQELFTRALRTLDPPLRILRVIIWQDYGPDEQDGSAFSSALEEVICLVWSPFNLHSPLYQSIKASQNTLCHLNLPLSVGSAEENDKCQFWQLHFPVLEYFEFSQWCPNLFVPLNGVTDFFLHHSDIIESVIFKYIGHESIDVNLTNAHGRLLLRSLTTDVGNFKDLVNTSISRIAPSLTLLDLRPEIDNEGRFLDLRLTDLPVVTLPRESIDDGTFPSLQDLSVTVGWTSGSDSRSNHSPADITKLLQRISTFAGRNLRRFSFFAPYPTLTPEELSSAISHFPSIVHLTLRLDHPGGTQCLGLCPRARENISQVTGQIHC